MNEVYEKKGFLLENFRLFHLRDDGGAKIDYHYHEFHKLLFLVSGSGGYYVEGKRYLLKSGDVVLVGSHCVHRPEFELGIPYERMILYISPDFLNRQSTSDCDLSGIFSRDYGHVLRPDNVLTRTLFSLVTSLEKELANTHYGRTILSNSILLQILVEIGRSFSKEAVQKPSPMVPKSKLILDIVRYLDAHLTEDISIDALAERFYLSRFHMMRQFKEETGTTIHTYLSDRRLLLARDLIAQGIPATDACFQCGFRTYSSFSRAYGKLFGSTPTGRKNVSAALDGTFE